ncbi:efflux RND transporter permease subunit [Anaeromyxobacter sp. Fw109-5]|uniref:efflux RND transporter permease subunit n=1 Tax=Anaeromyxobacter sp. (strain Fw109-5) TaxID=404589 RepID=UPI0000ED76FF|nr:efflux RND transporter permease subunit [Anaeromyxobacter sp. Fw109-5]ABS24782.1 transporter, hydrophobe/amphiphile efflux-1 (HAE1) family [Anaeromyxobacter sp. Fw109-5]
MAQFFIDRPIFAWVVAIIVMLAGALSILTLPVSQYPAIAPPTVSVIASYPGASAKTLEDTVTQVIEQRMTGLDGLRYMSSSSDSSGNAQLTLTFEAGTNPDIAQVQVQNKLQLAMPQLPQDVQRQGVRVVKSAASFLLIIGLVSEDGSMTRNDISDYAYASIQDQISRVNGVGEVQTFGSQYAMRIWLDPDRLTSFRLTPLDVSSAVQSQNAQVSGGQLGGLPAVEGQRLTATITAQTRLQTAEEFRNILLRVNPDGSQVRLGDVARVELAGESSEIETFFNGRPSSGIGVRLAAGANALDTAGAVRARMDELSKFFPPGLKAVYPVDTSPFVRLSIEEVVITLAEAIVLVFLVMYLFLQNFRATLIPTIAVPVVLLGTFGVLAAAGFSINTLTMFGLVLAIGLLVDDAIVVVENVERVMSEEGLRPKSATRKSMSQITGALVGIALVLSAVFVPMAFFGGSVGVIYRQFSITIVASMALSVLVALTLTPALCATLLKPVERGHGLARGGFFGAFNRLYDRGAGRYGRVVGFLMRRRVRALIAYGVIVAALAGLFARMPTGFLPAEDQGTAFAQILLPPGSTLQSTREVLEKVSNHLLTEEKDSVESVMSIAGFSFSARGQNTGVAFIRLKPWDEREGKHLKADAMAARAMRAFSTLKEANVFVFTPPAVSELGNANGFELQLQDRAGLGHDALMDARNQLLGLAQKDPRLAKVRPAGLEDTAQFKIDVDQQKAAALGISLADVNATIASTWGVSYVNDFIDKGRTKRVYLQADAPFRMHPEDVGRWYVRQRGGEMVPFSAFATGSWTMGSPKLERFNGLPAVAIQGEPAPGHSSGEAMAALEEIVGQLPSGVAADWSGLSYEERLSGANAPALYALSILVVFLCLAALYESWSIPVSVLLAVPLGVIGAVIASSLRGLPNDVYFQVGLLTTVGLSAKNAILIVEFARELHDRGRSAPAAALEAARMRLRPILMTSLAFVLGVLPLALASGAGAGSQNAIGFAVIGGMLSATALAILFVPLFFVLIARRAPAPAGVPPEDASGAEDVREDAAHA